MTLSSIRRWLYLGVIALILVFPAVTIAAPAGQEISPEEQAAELLSQLTPEERVGQLFLIEFEGNRVEEATEIYDLISNYHIGGVVLKRENNNFTDAGDPLLNTWLLVQEIQRTEISTSSIRKINSDTGESFSYAVIPLFVGITQDGDGFPEDQLLSKLTPLPNAMAIGATWNTDLAFSSGEVLAKELSSLGVNLLFGPSLNINNNPRPELGGDLGTTSFGGSPFWVGEMAGQFISGVHAGSSQIAVVSKHFPGSSGTDRPREEEIPTVRRTIDQLTGFEFRPFFNITGKATSAGGTTDGLLLSHAKYQAFQSNITTSTPPITLDTQALEQLVSVNYFSVWHESGGLVFSDELWNQAIQRFYEQQATAFRPALIARDALLAGNDVLSIGGLDFDGQLDPYATITNTLDFFAQKYRDDLAFAQRVDEAVSRILALKYKMYPAFDTDTILPSSTRLSEIGNSSEVVFEIARQSATLIDPSRENLANVLPGAPTSNEPIVIITDSHIFQQCSECAEVESLPETALSEEILRLYGESGDGLILDRNISAFSSTDLLNALDIESEFEPLVISEIRRSRWVVFLFIDSEETRPESQAMVRFLSEMPDLIQEKRTVVFSLNAPYYLDATSISQVTAYYGLFSKQPQFLEIAARLLFQEVNAPGASPVSISGAGYLLEEALVPDPDQVFELNLIRPNQEDSADNGIEVTPNPNSLSQGETVSFETSVIVDHNGNPVEDDTTVNLTFLSSDSEGGTSQREVTLYTVNGIGRTNQLLDTAGILEVTATTGDPELISNTLRLEIASIAEGGDVPVFPDSTTIGATPTSESGDGPLDPLVDSTSLVDWLISLIVIVFISLFTYQIGVVAGRIRWAVRWGLTSFLGGLTVTCYLSFGFPGSATLIIAYGIWGIVICAAIGCLLGWAAGLIWRAVTK
jgi:beta-N-acetylhexosaminidase